MFASSSLAVHLARGAVGVGVLVGSSSLAPGHPWVLLIGLPLAVAALRGCPMCWTLGLIETIALKVRGRAVSGACVDGSCALDGPPARTSFSANTSGGATSG